MQAKLIFFLLSLTICLSSQNRVDTILSKLNDPKLKEVLVAAHRGDWRNFPENSLAAIESAVKMGVDIVEVDVQRTKDGQLILMHDGTLDRTTTGKGKISDWTLDSIKTLKLKNGCSIKTIHNITTLEEALIYSKGKILINLDKADRFFDEIYPLLQKTGTSRQIIMKGRKMPQEVRAQFGDYLKDVIYMPVVDLDKADATEQVTTFLQTLHPVAFELLFVSDSSHIPLEMKEKLSGKSLIWYNTLWDTLAGGYDDDKALQNPDSSYGYLIETLGARIIQTDRPQFLIEYLKKKGFRK